MAVAVAGEQADPRVPAPTLLRPVLGFTRLSASSYGLIERVVDADEAFRERVAAAADEDGVGRAGYLWLTRPDGWEEQAASVDEAGASRRGGEASARLRREREGAEAAAARHRRRAEEAEAARDRAEEDLAAVRAAAATAEEERAGLAARVGDLEDERTELVRRLKAAEADAAALRRDLRVAREATRQAEAELLAGGPTARAVPAPRADPRVAEAQAAMSAAAASAADLARALEDAAASLAPDVDRPGGPPRARRSTRRPPALPAGLADDSPEAQRHLIAETGALLVVDGYNLARTAWPDLDPEEERRRTVGLLEEHRARTGAPVTVVFDGASDTVAPAASRSVRVRFSSTGQTADEAIALLLADLPAAQQVVVVTSDREVADDARRQGAAVLSSPEFLAAVGR